MLSSVPAAAGHVCDAPSPAALRAGLICADSRAGGGSQVGVFIRLAGGPGHCPTPALCSVPGAALPVAVPGFGAITGPSVSSPAAPPRPPLWFLRTPPSPLLVIPSLNPPQVSLSGWPRGVLNPPPRKSYTASRPLVNPCPCPLLSTALTPRSLLCLLSPKVCLWINPSVSFELETALIREGNLLRYLN